MDGDRPPPFTTPGMVFGAPPSAAGSSSPPTGPPFDLYLSGMENSPSVESVAADFYKMSSPERPSGMPERGVGSPNKKKRAPPQSRTSVSSNSGGDGDNTNSNSTGSRTESKGGAANATTPSPPGRAGNKAAATAATPSSGGGGRARATTSTSTPFSAESMRAFPAPPPVAGFTAGATVGGGSTIPTVTSPASTVTPSAFGGSGTALATHRRDLRNNQLTTPAEDIKAMVEAVPTSDVAQAYLMGQRNAMVRRASVRWRGTLAFDGRKRKKIKK